MSRSRTRTTSLGSCGFNSWDVSVTATAIAGVVDTAVGAAPWTMSIGAFNPERNARSTTAANPQAFGDGNGDYPVDATDIAWTDFNGNNNVNTTEVSGIIDGSNVVTATIELRSVPRPAQPGQPHRALRRRPDLPRGHGRAGPDRGAGRSRNCAAPEQAHQDGCFKGWAMFHVVSAERRQRQDDHRLLPERLQASPLTVGECTAAELAAGTCGVITPSSPFPAYLVRLTQ